MNNHNTSERQPMLFDSSLLQRIKLALIRIAHQHRALRRVLLRCESDIVVDIEDRTVLLVLDWRKVQQKIVLDSACHVRLEVLIIIRIQLRGDANVVGMRDHDVNMRRPVRVPSHDLQQICRWTRSVDCILGRFQAVEPELALLVCLELAAQVVPGLVLGIECVVFAIGARLPHVEDSARNALSCINIFDHAVEECLLSVFWHVLDDTAAELTERCLW